MRYARHAPVDRSLWAPRLPDPAAYYSARVRGLRRPNSRGFASGLCPFHEDHEPSFSVDLSSGRFRCFACGAHGDMVDFHMRSTGRNFREALEDLGAIPPAPPGTWR